MRIAPRQHFARSEIAHVSAFERVPLTPILEPDHDLSPDTPPGWVVPAHAPVYIYGTVQPAIKES
jgi:hypothetical protein